MTLGKIEVIYRIWFGVFTGTIIFAADPSHSQHVGRRSCGDQRLYFEKTGKCYQAQKRGPCGELMVLEPSAQEKTVGECNCDFIKKAFGCPQRPKLFWQEKSRCYHIYDQGPCTKGKWVVPHKNDPPTCERITCLEEYNAQVQAKGYYSGNNRFTFPYKGMCYKTLSTETGLCPREQILIFIGEDSLNFRCSEGLVCSFVVIPDLVCDNGSTPASLGGCEPNTIFRDEAREEAREDAQPPRNLH